MEKIIVTHSAGEYDIFAGEGILAESLAEFFRGRKFDRVFIVSDSNVFPLHGGRLRAALAETGIVPAGEFVFNAGEKSKTLETVSRMYEAFAGAFLTRHSLVIALGGGVCGDMTGFAAATYLRGVGVLQAPTTLLAQIDSSVGGKTGVDLPVGKNLVGAFHQPEAVIADAEFLETLPERYLRDGMGEAVKYGCIADAELFSGILDGSIGRAELISRCIRIKADVVSKDERESGLRMILNYGHTIGHAVEKLGGFSRFSHGESVGIGMLYAARIGEKLGYPPVFEAIRDALTENGLPTVMDYPPEELVKVAASDKKRDGDEISFVLLDRIGKAVVRRISIAELTGLLAGI